MEKNDSMTSTVLSNLVARPDIKRIVVPEHPKMILGQLRNLAVQHAETDYIAQWDDDDFYHPDRLTLQMQTISNQCLPACVLHRVLLVISGRGQLSTRRDWEGTLVCRRRDMISYPNLKRGEDTPVIEVLAKGRKLARLDRPDLFAYIYHGKNTWDLEHWNNLARHGSEIDQPEQRRFLELLLEDTRHRAATEES